MIHWNADPIMLSLGFIQIHWYGLLFSGAFMVGLFIMQRIYYREGLSSEELDNLFMYTCVGALLGARLGHCLFYDPVYYLIHPVEILKIWEGGLASHGGALGILSALALFTLRHRSRSMLWILDRMTMPAALGGSMIRIGNFINSEIVGLPTRRPWGVIFERVDMIPRHPVQLYEAASYLLIFAFLAIIYRRRGQKLSTGRLTGWFLTTVFSVRFFLENVKTPQAAFTLFQGLRMGQILSIPFIIAGIFFLIRSTDIRRPEP